MVNSQFSLPFTKSFLANAAAMANDGAQRGSVLMRHRNSGPADSLPESRRDSTDLFAGLGLAGPTSRMLLTVAVVAVSLVLALLVG